MHFCKKSIHISNVINTFLSHLTVVRGSRPGRWRRTSALREYWLMWRENKTKRQSRIRSTNRGFVKMHTHSSYAIRGNVFHVRQSAEVREKCLIRLKYGYFSYINGWIRYRRPLFTPGAVKRVLLRIGALFNVFWTVARTIFLYNSDWIVWKKKVIYT